jgi:hypothetical protein
LKRINPLNGGGIDPCAGDLDHGSGIAPWIAWSSFFTPWHHWRLADGRNLTTQK